MEKKTRRSKEEILLDKMQKEEAREAKKQAREIQKADEEAAKLARIAAREKTEEQIVHAYAKRVMDGKAQRGHVDKRFAHSKKSDVNKSLWMDTDFFFSVVFESSEQKYQFLDFIRQKFGIDFETYETAQIQIVNGIRFSKSIGMNLKREKAANYPGPPLDLMPYILDDEI